MGRNRIPPGYTLVRPISEGALDQVVEIKELSTGKSYALKLIPRLTEADQTRAEREVSLLEGFRHARIVGFHESVAMETYHGIVMDLGKRNLKDLMLDFESRNELIPLEVAVQISMDIAEGLCVMHTHTTHPMAHGDLKPENVLLTDDDHAMLCLRFYRCVKQTYKTCDLGAADASGVNVTRSASSMGTFEYNSPERLDDTDQKGTPASGIWSLGVMLHRMVTGRSLFESESLSTMIRAIADFNESKISTSLPPAVRAVLVRLLDPNPDSRPTSTELFKDRLLERMLGPETPLSKMKDRQIQLLEKKLADLIEEKSEEMVVLKQTLADLPIWAGTESLQTLDRTSHVLTPTTLTQTIKFNSGSTDWRTGFTLPIDEGEWELKIRYTEQSGLNVMLGFHRYPLPEVSTQTHCGCSLHRIGGDFVLSNGRMWKARNVFKPPGTNKECDTAGQTAAIRVNMRTREARLFVDDEEQPGIFTDIPSPLCLGISTGFTEENQSVEVLWLKLRRGHFWPVSGNHDIHYRLVIIINNLVVLADPDWRSSMRVTEPLDNFIHFEMVYQKVVIPAFQYVTFLISNRHTLFGDLFQSFMYLLSTLVDIGPFHRQTLELVLASPVVMALLSCLTVSERDDINFQLFQSLADSCGEWKKPDSDQHQSGHRIVKPLISEGFEDIVDQMWMFDTKEYHDQSMNFNMFMLSSSLGGNIYCASRQLDLPVIFII
ncbi:putative Stk1 family PASTA domain-containing Ser/Thr kinase [Blattamonas nauphoetae]|uniref:non-specific serine/threonine protein kinase n=1 Tax=Blattamonas nauphoetae TaxID=2049346 RepID=A0ABQ9X991_9EUKA|nr:putative Stk1 family PASTA domain-containing Ser/Thr kinase [Blattamonas nauphoetae]